MKLQDQRIRKKVYNSALSAVMRNALIIIAWTILFDEDCTDNR
jgi:hypothetical protein